MGVDKNGTLSRRKIKKVERKSELDAGGTCKTIEQVGYESDAHAIPLDVLVSISLLFGISTDELLNLETVNVLPLSGLTKEQCDLLRRIQQEYLVPSQRGKNFSEKRMKIIHDIIKSFG